MPLTTPRPQSPPAAAPAEVPKRVRRQCLAAQRPRAPEVAPASGHLPFRRQDRQSARSSARSRQPSIHPYSLAAGMNIEMKASSNSRKGTMPGLRTVSKSQGGLSALPSLARRSGPLCSAASSKSGEHDPFTGPGSVSLPSRGWNSNSSDDSLQTGRRVVSERQPAKRATFWDDAEHKSDGDTPSPARRLGTTTTTDHSLSCPGKLAQSRIRGDMFTLRWQDSWSHYLA